MSESWGDFIYYIQKSLYEGKQPNDDGYYVFTRKELADGAKLSLSTLDNSKFDIIYYFSEWCNLKRHGNYDELKNEMLYIDAKFVRGKLMFKRNPITLKKEFQHLWALPPLNSYFAYDYFDDKHRRRCNSSQKEYEAFPWSWTEEQIEKSLLEE